MSSPDDPGAAPASPVVTVPPVITVSKGQPTAAELAAVLTVLAACAGQAPAAAENPAPASLWAQRTREWFTLARPGPRSWRASALPR